MRAAAGTLSVAGIPSQRSRYGISRVRFENNFRGFSTVVR